jgi:hypothetical protein
MGPMTANWVALVDFHMAESVTLDLLQPELEPGVACQNVTRIMRLRLTSVKSFKINFGISGTP